MDPVRVAVSRPYTVAVTVLLAVLISVLSYQRIPVQLKPTVDNPVISVETIYRGASPVEVEEQVTRRIEDLLQSVDGLDRLSSSSVEGSSEVSLEYTWGVDKDRAVIDVINKLSELQDLPPDAEKPVVSVTNQQGGNAVMWIASRSRYDVNRMRQIIADQVEARLERVAGVASLLVVGGEEREIRVLADPERLASRGLTWDELVEALRTGAVDSRGGTVETPTRQLVVRTEGRSADPQYLADIVVRRDESGTVRVGDVARIVDGYRETASVVHNESGPMVAIGVRSEPGANVVELTDGVEKELAAINERFAEQGLDASLQPVYRDTTYLNQALDFVWESLWQGALLSIVALLLFLRSVRSVLIIAVVIPVSLVTVFPVMELAGRTLNVVSLAGLAFASGMVADNAIVVLENTFRHLEMGKGARQAAMDAGREVWGGVLASTLTNIVVLLPILGIAEEAGQLFADLVITIAASAGLALLVALAVVPCLAALFYRNRTLRRVMARAPGPTAGTDPGAATAAATEALAGGALPDDSEVGTALGEMRAPSRLARWYGRSVERLSMAGRPAMRRRLLLVGVILAVSVSAVFVLPPAGYLPSGNANLIFFFGQPIPGMRAETLAQDMAPLEDWMKAQPETLRYFLVVVPGFNGGGVILKDEYADGPTLDDYRSRMQPQAFGIPGFRSLFPVRTSLFRDSGKQFTVEVTGPDLKRLADASRRLQAQIETLPLVAPHGVSSDYVEGRPELRVTVDPHRAAEAGLNVQQIGQVVEAALAGRRVGTFSDGTRDFDINLVVPPERVRSEQDLGQLPLVTPTGTRTTLGALATVATTTGPLSVNRLERERSISLTVNLLPEAVLQTVLADVQNQAVAPVLASLPSGYHVTLGGSADKFSSTLEALTSRFWLALLINYLLLVALFQSWASPLVIMVTVPLALTGGLLGITLANHLSSNATFDLLSMLGFVILASIVVNNAILIVHQSNNLRERGAERRFSLAEAARTRLRPILMSVLTTVFGMLPLAFGSGSGAELYQGLAAVMVGGLVLSTVFTLFLVPAMVSLGWDLEEWWKARRASPAPAAAPTPST